MPINVFKGTAADYVARANLKHANSDFAGAMADYDMAIALDPTNAVSYNYRANAFFETGNLIAAIADFTKAIELQPNDSQIYCNRGFVRSVHGDLDGAIADYSQAIILAPNSVGAYFNRAYAKRQRGDMAGAFADYTETIQRDASHSTAYFNRGLLRYDAREFAEALEDFQKSLSLKLPGDLADFARFRIWLILAQMGKTQAATAEIQAYLTDKHPAEPDDWLHKIGCFLAGKISEPELFSATTSPDKKINAGRTCEAYFYAGAKWLIAGNKEAAGDYFRKSIASGVTNFHEYSSALAELKLLKL